MGKVAKLVEVSLMARVIVDENATDEEILKEAECKFIYLVRNELEDNLVDIKDDTTMPYGSYYFDTANKYD